MSFQSPICFQRKKSTYLLIPSKRRSATSPVVGWRPVQTASQPSLRRQRFDVKMWSAKYLSEYWILGTITALLVENRWARRCQGWTLILPMANSNTKFLPLASFGQLAGHCPKHRSLVPILHRLHVLCPAMIFFFTFDFFCSLYIQCFCVSPPVPQMGRRSAYRSKVKSQKGVATICAA